MPKTPEQKTADEALEKAVQDVVRAYGLIPPDSMIAEFIVLGEGIRFVDDDDTTADMFAAYKNGHVRLTTALGILELGKELLKPDAAEGDIE